MLVPSGSASSGVSRGSERSECRRSPLSESVSTRQVSGSIGFCVSDGSGGLTTRSSASACPMRIVIDSAAVGTWLSTTVRKVATDVRGTTISDTTRML